jgi:hypothetical protein
MLALTTTKIVEIFIDVDDFMIDFSEFLSESSIGQTEKPDSQLSASEIITICIIYHHSRMDCFKTFYQLIVLQELKSYFPQTPCYDYFICLKKYYLFELFAFLWTQRLCPVSGANQVDSKKLEVCHIKREHNHKVMRGLAGKGKSSTGWFYGMKLHLIINQQAQLCRFMITGGNVADNNPTLLKTLFKGLQGTFFGDRGYLSKLKKWFANFGIKLITKIRKNMKPQALTQQEKHYLKNRSIIETVFGLLSFQCDIDHTRHRSQSGFFINLFSGLIAYSYLDKLPQVKRFSAKEINQGQIVLIHD